MHKRIEKFARESGAWNQVYGNRTFMIKETFDVEKFAELIVRECVSTVENLSPGYQDYRNQIEDAFRRDCVEQIKQHFGVEE